MWQKDDIGFANLLNELRTKAKHDELGEFKIELLLSRNSEMTSKECDEFNTTSLMGLI